MAVKDDWQEGDKVVAMIGLFSGRENPSFELEAEESNRLLEMSLRAIGRERIHPPPVPKLGEFYGFLVRVPGPLREKFGSPGRMRVFHGVITTEGDQGEEHWRDGQEIEGFLARLAQEKGQGQFLDLGGFKGSGGGQEAGSEPGPTS